MNIARNCSLGLVVACHLMAVVTGRALNRYVSLDGGHDTAGGYTNWAGAATGIQYAISASLANDVVWVSNGTYEAGATVISGVTNRVALTNTITLRSLNNDPANTIIKGGVNIRPVYMVDNSKLIGFTLTNGSFATTVAGDGLLGQSTLAVVSNCLITGNAGLVASGGGGVRYGTLYNCRIVANTAVHGGGAYQSVLYDCLVSNNLGTNYGGGVNRCFVYNSTIAGNSALLDGGGGMGGDVSLNYSMSNCTLSGNSAKGNGGGVSVYTYLFDCRLIGNSANNNAGGALQGNLYNCTLSSNMAGNGGGISGVKAVNCILSGNTAINNGGGGYSSGSLLLTNCLLIGNSAVAAGGGIYGSSAPYATLYNCTLSGNSSSWGGGIRYATLWNCVSWNNNLEDRDIVAYYSCGRIYTGEGTTTNNPLFVASTNFRLQASSPCINAGTNQAWMTNARDMDGRPRLDMFSKRVDMGAYEYLSSGMLFSAY